MKKLSKFLAGLFIGAILGSALATLLAPMAGTEMRAKIEENYLNIRNEVQNAAKQRSEELKIELAKLQKKS